MYFIENAYSRGIIFIPSSVVLSSLGTSFSACTEVQAGHKCLKTHEPRHEIHRILEAAIYS
jgi:hypothetical protein